MGNAGSRMKRNEKIDAKINIDRRDNGNNVTSNKNTSKYIN